MDSVVPSKKTAILSLLAEMQSNRSQRFKVLSVSANLTRDSCFGREVLGQFS